MPVGVGAEVAWERKPFKLVHRGMNWNRPIDLIPEGQYAYAKNMRNYRDGQIELRPGLTLFTNSLGVPDYIHTITSLADYSPDTNFGPFAYVIGADGDLFVGPNDGVLSNPGLNPVRSGLSGKPLSTVAFQPEGGRAWMYIGDSTAMFSVGYHPTDDPGAVPARVYTMGLQPPVNVAIPAVGAAGNLTGSYQWRFTYRRRYTGARSNPSAPTRVTLAIPALVLAAQKATFTLPGPPVSDMIVDVYRFGGTVSSWRYVGSGNPGAAFTDNLADLDILTADVPPSAFNEDTGAQRFTLYQPFPTTDIARSGTCNLAADVNGVWYITRTGGDNFNQNWVPGTSVLLNGERFTIWQARSATILELKEDGALVGGAGAYNWETRAGAVYSGQAMSHIWGPFGAGEGGAYLFACGDPMRSHVLYWTNGNDPDSTDIVNSLEVTSPSEPLRGGCIYDGKCFVWSSERMFAVYPSLVRTGQFYVQEVPGARGLYYEWSLTVQTGALQDKSITWVGKDGIYDWSNVNGLTALTKETMNPFFPRDNQPGSALSELFSIPGEEVSVPDPAKNDKQRLFWNDGFLFYDFAAVDGHQYTLVYDSTNTKGWVAVDTYVYDLPMSRGKLINFHQLLVSIGSSIYVYTGVDDAGQEIPYRLVTGMSDLGDPRAEKELGDLVLDLDTVGTGGMTVLVRTDEMDGAGVQTLQSFAMPALSGRKQPVIDVPDESYVRTVGLDISGTASVQKPVLLGWEATFVIHPERTVRRPTVWSNGGSDQDKRVTGVRITANTNGVSRAVNIQCTSPETGAVSTTTIAVNHSRRTKKTYTLPTLIASLLRVAPQDATLWKLYDAEWIYEPLPPLFAGARKWTNLGSAKAKYLQGAVVPIDTNGQEVGLTLSYTQDTDVSGVTSIATANLIPTAGATSFVNMEYLLTDTPPDDVRTTFRFSKRPVYVLYNGLTLIEGVRWRYTGGPNFEIEILGWDSAVLAPLATDTIYAQVIVQDAGLDDVAVSAAYAAVTALGAVSTPPGYKSGIPYSLTNPIIVHHVSVVPTAACRIWEEEIQWIWEPVPEIARYWETQETTHDMDGYHFLFDGIVAYICAGAPTLTVTTEHGAVVYSLPDAAGGYMRAPLRFLPQKGLRRKYRIEHASGLRLFVKDCEVRGKSWNAAGGGQGQLLTFRPFGDLSREAGARI